MLWLLVIVLTIATIVQAVQLSSVDNQLRNAEILFSQIKTDQNTLSSGFTDVNDRSLLLAGEVDTIKENVAELWYSTIPTKDFKKIEKWFNENQDDLSECLDGPSSANLNSGFMGYKGEIGDTLILDFPNTGQIAIMKNATVGCYKYPFTSITPPTVNCSTFCDAEDQDLPDAVKIPESPEVAG